MNTGQINMSMLLGVKPSVTSDTVLAASTLLEGSQQHIAGAFADVLNGMEPQAKPASDTAAPKVTYVAWKTKGSAESPAFTLKPEILRALRSKIGRAAGTNQAPDEVALAESLSGKVQGEEVAVDGKWSNTEMLPTDAQAIIAAYSQSGRMPEKTVLVTENTDVLQGVPVAIESENVRTSTASQELMRSKQIPAESSTHAELSKDPLRGVPDALAARDISEQTPVLAAGSEISLALQPEVLLSSHPSGPETVAQSATLIPQEPGRTPEVVPLPVDRVVMVQKVPASEESELITAKPDISANIQNIPESVEPVKTAEHIGKKKLSRSEIRSRLAAKSATVVADRRSTRNFDKNLSTNPEKVPQSLPAQSSLVQTQQKTIQRPVPSPVAVDVASAPSQAQPAAVETAALAVAVPEHNTAEVMPLVQTLVLEAPVAVASQPAPSAVTPAPVPQSAPVVEMLANIPARAASEQAVAAPAVPLQARAEQLAVPPAAPLQKASTQPVVRAAVETAPRPVAEQQSFRPSVTSVTSTAVRQTIKTVGQSPQPVFVQSQQKSVQQPAVSAPEQHPAEVLPSVQRPAVEAPVAVASQPAPSAVTPAAASPAPAVEKVTATAPAPSARVAAAPVAAPVQPVSVQAEQPPVEPAASPAAAEIALSHAQSAVVASVNGIDLNRDSLTAPDLTAQNVLPAINAVQNILPDYGTDNAIESVQRKSTITQQQELGRTPIIAVDTLSNGGKVQEEGNPEPQEIRPVTMNAVRSAAGIYTPIAQHGAAPRVNSETVTESGRSDSHQTDVKEMTELSRKPVTSVETSSNSEDSPGKEKEQSGYDQTAGNHNINPLQNDQAKSVRLPVDSTVTAPAEAAHQSNAEQIVNQVRERLTQHELKSGAQHITLTLSPENLGELKMNLNLQGQKLSVEIVTENQTVRDAIVKHTDALKESLARQNITMESFDVTTGGKGSGNQGQNQNAWREMAQQKQQQFFTSKSGYRIPQEILPQGQFAYQRKSEHTMLDILY